MDAKLDTVGGAAVLRFERRFNHPVDKVWRAVTEPAQLAQWFPATVETELKVGAPIKFTFPAEAPVDEAGSGEILEYDPPKVYAFRWNNDVLRLELVPDGDGTILHFSQTLGGGGLGRLSAGRNAAGWDTCLAVLEARLDGRDPEPPGDWLSAMVRYLDVFGLADGKRTDTPDGAELRFALDLVWKPVDDARDAVREMAENVERGIVHWELIADPEHGNRVELTHTLPAAEADAELAAWPARLCELLRTLHPAGHTDR